MPNKKQSSNNIDEAHYRYWHLGDSPHEGKLTDLEWCVLRYQQAFERWVVQLGAITGLENLNYIEIQLLNVIRMQDRPKTAASIARQLNRDDIPNIQYVLRKLVRDGLCEKVSTPGSKSTDFAVTEEGKKMQILYEKELDKSGEAIMKIVSLNDRQQLIEAISRLNWTLLKINSIK